MRDIPCTEFIVSIPTVFDKTIIPSGRMGEYIISVRKAGNDWYIGALTNWDARHVEVVLDFLDDGDYVATLLLDGLNAAKRGEDHLIETRSVKKSDKLLLNMAPGGGAAIKLIKTK
jgi:alpha-glucosidase